MSTVYALTVVIASLAWPSPSRGQAPAAAPASCDPAGPVKFVCGQAGPEDLVAVPNTRWLVASAFGGDGGLFLIDTRAASSTKIYPSATVAARLDKTTYDTCPGPPQTAPRFQTHGLFLQEGAGGRHTLYVVHHGSRESVEVFELDARGQSPSLAWIGCAIAPDPIGLNSVMALPGGGFVATNFQPRAPAGAPGGGFQSALINGQNNGELWEWHAGRGWAKVPGSESAGANGIEMSKDGKWFYVAQWGNRSFMRVSRGVTPVVRETLNLGFRVDNVRWAPDGTLLVAGQGGPDCAVFGRGGASCNGVATSTIGKVDPVKWTYTTIVDYPTSPTISAATVAIQVGDELWAGSFRGDRISRYPAKGLR
jgi:hypothetical protein